MRTLAALSILGLVAILAGASSSDGDLSPQHGDLVSVAELKIPGPGDTQYTGSCGGSVTDSDGNRISCPCSARPVCEGGRCWCSWEDEDYCESVAC